MLFYNNKIKCGYEGNPQKKFAYSDSPFLFIDVPDGEEQRKGTSFFNEEEAEVITLLTDHCIKTFRETLKRNKRDPRIPIQKFTKNSVYVITPYNA